MKKPNYKEKKGGDKSNDELSTSQIDQETENEAPEIIPEIEKESTENTSVPNNESFSAPEILEKPDDTEFLNSFLKELQELKKKGNDCFKSNDLQKCEAFYRDGTDKVEEFTFTYKGEKENPAYKSILDEKVCLYSNLAMCLHKMDRMEESLELDMMIVMQLDPNWDKSYNRILLGCLKKNDLASANNYANIFRVKFDTSTLAKYESTFTMLDSENMKKKVLDDKLTKEKEDKLREELKNKKAPDNTSLDSSSIINSKTNLNLDNSRKKKSTFLGFLFRVTLGGLFIFGGFFTLYLLTRGKKSISAK